MIAPSIIDNVSLSWEKNPRKDETVRMCSKKLEERISPISMSRAGMRDVSDRVRLSLDGSC